MLSSIFLKALIKQSIAIITKPTDETPGDATNGKANCAQKIAMREKKNKGCKNEKISLSK